MVQLYPQALGSLSVASYDSQDYGGDILIRPTRDTDTLLTTLVLLTAFRKGSRRKYRSQQFSMLLHVAIDLTS
jgi:hypothetical protein